MSILSHTAKTELKDAKNEIKDASTDISQEFKSFVADIETMIKETASLSGDDLARAQIKINQRILSAKQHINRAANSIAHQAVEQTRKAAVRTNEYVHEQPWAVIGTGALVSFVLGLLLGNSHHREDRSAK